ncbi:MAG: DMT family transporter [Proteobacteria bacterium]|nr:DMT family transporter [Pseudomonadota bacterium]
MLWFYLALASAIGLSITDTLSKVALKESGSFVVAWVRWVFAAPFLLLILPFIEIPVLDSTFWIVTLVAIPLEIAAILLYMQAIKVSPLSLTIPFLALTPVFLIVTSFLFLGELPDLSGLAGIMLIAFGAYMLNLKSRREGLFAPFKAIARERGSLMMIGVAMIYSITANLGKIALQHSSPLFFAVIYTLLISATMTPFVFMLRRDEISKVGRRPVLFIMIGVAFGLMILSHFAAIALIEVPYMISVKRSSMIFSVLSGFFLFKESDIKDRLAGAMLMLAGIVLILL